MMFYIRVPVPTAVAVGADENLDNNSTLEDDNLSIISDDSDDFVMPDVYPNNNNHPTTPYATLSWWDTKNKLYELL